MSKQQLQDKDGHLIGPICDKNSCNGCRSFKGCQDYVSNYEDRHTSGGVRISVEEVDDIF